jgi:hypothetical protein
MPQSAAPNSTYEGTSVGRKKRTVDPSSVSIASLRAGSAGTSIPAARKTAADPS